MHPFISVVIPVHNGEKTISACLEAVLASAYGSFEVIVVDDASDDSSAEVISRYPCRLVRLDRRSGASGARNAGAREASGDILFFIDADCVVLPGTLSAVNSAMAGDRSLIVGGSYTPIPFDPGFFNAFQSVLINYSELKSSAPDYIASHAMAIDRTAFLDSGGFPEKFLPILEDVEFSHRLRRAGRMLRMDPAILVSHIFGFSMKKSLRNAFRKARYWTVYSIRNRDLLSNSGTASIELKTNVACFALSAAAVCGALVVNRSLFIFALLIQAGNLWTSRRLLASFGRHRGAAFALAAAVYYALAYAPVVGLGGLTGAVQYVLPGRRGPSS